MKQHTFLLRSTRRGPQYIHTTVFAGFVEPGGTLANCGSLVMNIGEWQAFGALLLLGAAHSPPPAKVTQKPEAEKVANLTKQINGITTTEELITAQKYVGGLTYSDQAKEALKSALMDAEDRLHDAAMRDEN